MLYAVRQPSGSSCRGTDDALCHGFHCFVVAFVFLGRVQPLIILAGGPVILFVGF